MHLFVDIETIPSQRADVRARLESVKPTAPANYKDPKKIAAYIEEHADDWREQWHRTALDGGYGELCCIGWAVENGDVQTVTRPTVDDSEADMLTRWYDRVCTVIGRQTPTWVGHNVEFDLRFLHHRSIVLGVRPSVWLPYNAPAWRNAYIDTMFEWSGTKGSVKLTDLCDMLGIEAEDEIDGSGVWNAYQAGKIDQIEQHCRADVERTRAVFKRLRWMD